MKKIFLALCAMALLVACSDDDSAAADNNGTLLKKAVATANGGEVIESAEFFYSEGNRLFKKTVTSGGGGTAYYEYTGDLITKITFYRNEELKATQRFTYDAEGNLTQVISENNTTDYASRLDYVYNTDGTVDFTRYEGTIAAQTTLKKKRIGYLQPNGNVSKIESYNINTNALELTCEFTYDDKPTPYSGILGYDKALIDYELNLVHRVNNLLSSYYTAPSTTETDTDVSEYEYNASGYPTKATGIDWFDMGAPPSIVNYYYQ